VVERDCSFSVSNQFVRVKQKRLLPLLWTGTGITHFGTYRVIEYERGGWKLRFVRTTCILVGAMVAENGGTESEDRELDTDR
jgi:hypothetical protein